MNKVIILPPEIINQIAAGEVVERPASILKELLENSVDANADDVKIFVENGGIKSIKVVDNGSGMSAEDAEIAFLPHSTSKISSAEDLENILTLGFRGEALASISSVSKINLKTKIKNRLSGFEIKIEGGKIVKKQEAGSAEGTQIIVSEIFFNTPARRKFLKSENTELRHIINTFTNIALANPEARFELWHNGRNLFTLPKTRDLRERIRNLTGGNFTDNSFKINYDGIIKINGYAGLPKIATKRKITQIIIVNKRAISNQTISAAVKEAFYSTIPHNLYPQFVIFLEIDSKKIDVNVHPRKLEVRFSNQQEVFNAVKIAVKSGLENALRKEAGERFPDFSPKFRLNNFRSQKIFPAKNNDYKIDNAVSKTAVKDSMSFSKEVLDKPVKPAQESLPWEESEGTDKTFETDEEHFQAFQLLNSYIITTNGRAIQIIDQHAAAERVAYEKLKREVEEKKVEIQSLLIPFEIELNPQERLILDENIEVLKNFGFEIEEFGGNSYVVRQIPVDLKKADLNLLAKELLVELANSAGNEHNICQEIKEKIITTLACHGSVRVGDKLSQLEIMNLVKNLKKCDQPYSCPHGRPIIFEIPLSELERRFGR